MVIIAFAPKSSKFLPNIFCKRFRHCAVIVRRNKDFIMYQFTMHKRTEQIPLRQRDIRILAAHGWHFVYIPCEIEYQFNPGAAWTCVGMAKRAIKIHAPWILTPYALYKWISE